MQKAGSAYRPDIDGLRAVAVLSVVLFHMSHSLLPGGYAGVDVFFVISGFLIAGIIHREIVSRNFSILAFYERRIRRIYPALLATLLATLVAGFVLFMPDELRDLGASVVAAIAFSSNILFWLQTDYFAGPAELKPLLHTWSLAVEEQYYILIPPLMLLVHRFWPGRQIAILTLLTIASFAASCAWVFLDPSGNYYLPHTRAWELLVGALVALGAFPKVRSGPLAEVLALAGFTFMVAPFFLLSDASAFPAWNALATCLGTGLLLHVGATHPDTNVARFLALRPMVAVGLISYSVYLVHWPLIVFTRYQLLRDPDPAELIGLFAATLALGWMSWRFIERPFREKARFPRARLFGLAAAGSLLLAVIGGAAFVGKGFPQRLGDRAALAVKDRAQEAPSGCFLKGDWRAWKGDACFLVPGQGKATLLWGDSHANHFAPVLKENRLGLDKPVLLYASAGCPPVLDVEVPLRKNCRQNNAQVLRIIKQYNVDRVILSSYWPNVLRLNDIPLSAVTASVHKLRAMGLDVRVIANNPDFPFANPQFLAVRLAGRGLADKPFYTAVRNDFTFNPALRAALPGVPFYDPMEHLCRGEQCLAYENGKLLMTDNSHLSVYGANRVLRDARSLFQ